MGEEVHRQVIQVLGMLAGKSLEACLFTDELALFVGQTIRVVTNINHTRLMGNICS